MNDKFLFYSYLKLTYKLIISINNLIYNLL